MNLHQISKTYSVSRTTTLQRLASEDLIIAVSTKMGGPTALLPELENELVKHFLSMEAS